MAQPELSAVVLCYRAESDIKAVLVPLHRQLQASRHAFELVLVANYWPDKPDTTPEVVTAFAKTHDQVVVLSEPKQGGMGSDFRAGLAAASGDIIVVIDGDSQNPTEDVLRMFTMMKDTGHDVMKGLRIARYDSLYRRFISVVYNFLFRFLFRTKGLWDINGKPKGLTRSAYDAMNLTSDDWFIDAEIVLEAKRLGLRVAEMPVVFRRNDHRQSLVKLNAIFEFLRHMFARRVRSRP